MLLCNTAESEGVVRRRRRGPLGQEAIVRESKPRVGERIRERKRKEKKRRKKREER